MISRAIEFERNGWLIVDFGNEAKEILERTHERLLSRLRERWIPEIDRLENYHRHIDDDDQHTEIQHDLTKLLQNESIGLNLVRAEIDFLRDLVGPDLHVQKYPYLRIARPEKMQDNIGFHRDTHYGGTPYELSVHIPFTDAGKDGSLGVLTGSHILPERAFPTTQRPSSNVEKGSRKHQLGFLYAPKELEPVVRGAVEPVHTRPGQMLIFSLSLIHGQEVNLGDLTRFSSDLRVVNSLAPIQWERNVHQDYYVRLCESAVTAQARRYYSAETESTDPKDPKT